jgi:hypothetical protein|tara:strand:- start:787 stop:1005 length:219 start_codon:yes stop_codon:yes gene_type:complete
MKLSDATIAHIAQLVQLAMLTGTDVVDHMRMMTLVETEGQLFLDPDYESQSDDNIQRMIQEAVRMQSESAES